MKSIPEVQVENNDPGMPSGGAGAPDKVWTITGRVLVRESETDGDLHDRPLKGIEVKVSASAISDSLGWNDWGTVRTNSDGDFSLRHTQNADDRFFRVEARLVGSDLEVNESKVDDLASFDLLDKNWRTIWKSSEKVDGPTVSIGSRVFASENSFDLGSSTYRRQALIWYVLRTAIDRLESEDSWFAMNHKIAAIYPAHVVSGTSYTNGLTRMIYLHQGQPDDDWKPDVVLHEFMHMWNYHHNTGTINWFGAVCSLRGPQPVDGTTHNHQENPNVAFAEGFSEMAARALLHELWGQRRRRPYNRRYVATRLKLTTLEMAEKSEYAVDSALRMLHVPDREGWWSHLFGTTESYPDNLLTDDLDGDGDADYWYEVGVKQRLDQRIVPSEPTSLSLWDILRTFRANPAAGWSTDLQVGNVDYGIVRVIERAVDIHGLSNDTRLMLLRCLDPLATDEPYEALDKV